jgi:hypothetical protein
VTAFALFVLWFLAIAFLTLAQVIELRVSLLETCPNAHSQNGINDSWLRPLLG